MRCSTPDGVTANGTRHYGVSGFLVHACSTPDGVTANGTQVPYRVERRRLGVCSTPDGVTANGTVPDRNSAIHRHVLNA